MTNPKNRNSTGANTPNKANWTAATPWARSIRETFESIVIAFILAFLFRTFEVEAFVIPTGSMAPTLSGRHLDIACPECGYRFRVGAKYEDDTLPPNRDISSCICPNCNFAIRFDPHMTGHIIADENHRLLIKDDAAEMYRIQPNPVVMIKNLPGKLDDLKPGDDVGFLYNVADGQVSEIFKSPNQAPQEIFYSGDRILVSKFAFDFTSPKRWDVIVFKYPEDAKTNYIKRLIGLPNEIIRIRDGDIAISHDGGKTFESATRSPTKLQAMLQVVYDNDYIFEPMWRWGWPSRWHDGKNLPDPAWTMAKTASGEVDPKAFVVGEPTDSVTAAKQIRWLRYSHYVPSRKIWDLFEKNGKLASANRPTGRSTITDFVAYDGSYGPGGQDGAYNGDRQYEGGQVPPVVSDLAVDCTVDVPAAKGKLILECVKNRLSYQCVFDLTAGTAELMIPGVAPADRPKAKSGCISAAGSYRVELANVDRQLTVWVNDTPVEFDRPTALPTPRATSEFG